MRHRTFTVRAESQNGVNPVPTHYDFNLFTIGAGSDRVWATHLATNYGASVAICEFPFSTISSETIGGVDETWVSDFFCFFIFASIELGFVNLEASERVFRVFED